MSIPKIPDQDDTGWVGSNLPELLVDPLPDSPLLHILLLQKACGSHHDAPGRIQDSRRCQPLDPSIRCRVNIYKPFARTDLLPPIRANLRIRHHQPATNRLDIEIAKPAGIARIMKGHPRDRIPGRIPNLDLAALEIRGIQEIRAAAIRQRSTRYTKPSASCWRPGKHCCPHHHSRQK
jgi:hypothetical protein